MRIQTPAFLLIFVMAPQIALAGGQISNGSYDSRIQFNETIVGTASASGAVLTYTDEPGNDDPQADPDQDSTWWYDADGYYYNSQSKINATWRIEFIGLYEGGEFVAYGWTVFKKVGGIWQGDHSGTLEP